MVEGAPPAGALPAFCLPRRGYRVEVIGAALLAAADGAGYARAAAACAVPASTVRDWVRSVRRDASRLIGHAAGLLQSTGDASTAWPTPLRPLPPLTAAVFALGAAARGLAGWLARPDRSAGGTITGIDYLDLLARQHRWLLLHQLRLADPSDAARHATPWQLVTILTAGRLLTGSNG